MTNTEAAQFAAYDGQHLTDEDMEEMSRWYGSADIPMFDHWGINPAAVYAPIVPTDPGEPPF